MSKIYEFESVIQLSEKFSNGTYIVIPFDVEQSFGKKRVKIKATFDGVPYQGSLVRMGSPEHILIIRKDIRAKIGKAAGDRIQVRLQEDTEPRVVVLPEDFKNLLAHHPQVQQFFAQLSYTHQKEYVNWIVEAKRPETRTRRMHKAIEMMQAGKKGR
ncbi:MAG: YdeI/OmpD-associated family protein [Bacteroidota bacterium]